MSALDELYRTYTKLREQHPENPIVQGVEQMAAGAKKAASEPKKAKEHLVKTVIPAAAGVAVAVGVPAILAWMESRAEEKDGGSKKKPLRSGTTPELGAGGSSPPGDGAPTPPSPPRPSGTPPPGQPNGAKP